MRSSSMTATQPMHTSRAARMRGVLLASIAFGLVASSAAAQDRKGIRFWNLTLYTITTFQMSPAGKDSWGPDQCENDRDGTVDHDERLRITGIEPGRPCSYCRSAVSSTAIVIRPQAYLTPWQRGWRSHPSRPATGSRRVRDA